MQNTRVLQKPDSSIISKSLPIFSVGFSKIFDRIRAFPNLSFSVGILAAIMISRILSLDTESEYWFTLCWWKQWFGTDCIGCGMGRAIVCFFRGEFARSLEYHPMGVPTGIGFCLLLFAYTRADSERWRIFLEGRTFSACMFLYGFCMVACFLYRKF